MPPQSGAAHGKGGKRLQKFWKQINWMKALKIAAGAVAAILIAEAMGLQNAASAGIITLLTVQNTRRETVMSSVRRVLAFCIMTLLSMPLYHFCGTEPWTFGLVLLLLLLICYGLHMEDSTPINAVMATHYMLAGGVTSGMVGNELLLLLIGSGIGVCLNWFMPRNRNRIQRMQQELDGEIQGILERMAVQILEADHTGYGDSCFAKTEQLSAALRREIDIFLQNQTWEDDTYWMRYVMMRREQCRVLEEMYRQLLRLTQIPEQAKPLSEFFGEVAQHFHEGNDCTALLTRLEQLHTAYQEDALPETREAFENRALLYCILTELRTFLQIKQQFYLSLPEQERKQVFERLAQQEEKP